MTDDTTLVQAIGAIRFEPERINHTLDLIFKGMPFNRQLEDLNKNLKAIADLMPD